MPPEQLKELVSSDPATAYRLLSADPTARNLLLSLDILAEEVFQQCPTARPVAYLMMTKVIQSTLYAAAQDEEAEIYRAAQHFGNCVQLSMIDRNVERLRALCKESLSSATTDLLEKQQ